MSVETTTSTAMQIWMDVYIASIRSGSLGSRAKIEADKAMTEWKTEFVVCPDGAGNGPEAEPDENVIEEAAEQSEAQILADSILDGLKPEDRENILKSGGLLAMAENMISRAARGEHLGEKIIDGKKHYLRGVLHTGGSIDKEPAPKTKSDTDGALDNLKTFGEVWAKQIDEGMIKAEIIEYWAKDGKKCLRLDREVDTLERQLGLADRMGREGDSLASLIAAHYGNPQRVGTWNQASDAYADAREKGKKV